MVFAVAIPAALILIFHEAAIQFGWPLRLLTAIAGGILLLGILAASQTGDSGIAAVSAIAAYQLLLYVAVRHGFKRFEKRELRAALWNANLDRKLYIDWWWWVGWVVLAMVVPTILGHRLSGA